MNKKGFAISIILYSLVFLIISIFYMLLSIVKTRYTVTSGLRESVIEELSSGNSLYTKIATLGDDSSVNYVQKYNNEKGNPIDTADGTGDKEVYYYTGTNARTNSNVIFGNYCWQIVRTTKTGGVKLIYNGIKTSDNKCPNDENLRPKTIGVQRDGSTGIKISNLSGSKIYGTKFEIFNDNGTYKFRLLNTTSYSWSNSTYQDIIGKYVCGTSSEPTGDSTTCTTLYNVGYYYNNDKASTVQYLVYNSSRYWSISQSPYNPYSNSLAYVGYMYNDVFKVDLRQLDYSYSLYQKSGVSLDYYYGDEALWVTDHYELRMSGVTPTATSAWSDIKDSAIGMYTCLSTTNTSCTNVYYIVGIASPNLIYSIQLYNGEQPDTKSVTWTIGTSYTENNGNYSLTGTRTLSFLLKDWYTDYNNDSYKNFYICDNMTSSTCSSEVYYVGGTSSLMLFYNKVSKTYVFANDVEYVNGKYKLILNNPTEKPYKSIWNWYKDYNTINSTHYTCFDNYDSVNNTCDGSIYYVIYADKVQSWFIKLSNGDKIEDALQKMLNINNSNSSGINKYNSTMKSIIDSWFSKHLESYGNYLDMDVVFCNDRTVKNYFGWSPTGDVTDRSLHFKNIDELTKDNASLSCNNVTDRFSVNNNKAKLTYPIGLLTEPERALMGKDYASAQHTYWLMSPAGGRYDLVGVRFVNASGGSLASDLDDFGDIRPVIALKPGVEVSEGNGTYNTPYIIDAIPEELSE